MGKGTATILGNLFLLLMVQNTCEPAKLGSESNDSYGLKKILETSGIAGFSELSTDSADNGDESNGPEGK